MRQYLDLCQRVLDTGMRVPTRTGVDTYFLPGESMSFDLRYGFPAVTAKKLFFSPVKSELLGFLRGYTNAADFRALGCNVWNANANDKGPDNAPNAWLTNPARKGHDDLGRIYGAQWRAWRGNPEYHRFDEPDFPGNMNVLAEDEDGSWLYKEIDQLAEALHTLSTNPVNRRVIVTAWNPAELHLMSLPPCHVMYHFIPNVTTNELNLCMYQRSGDLFLGVPFNIASAALFLTLVARATGFRPATFKHFIGDAHIYVEHEEQTRLMLSRTPYEMPYLTLGDQNLPEANVEWLENLDLEKIELVNYRSHPTIPAKMMV
jgi:thymidylate synthase